MEFTIFSPKHAPFPTHPIFASVNIPNLLAEGATLAWPSLHFFLSLSHRFSFATHSLHMSVCHGSGLASPLSSSHMVAHGELSQTSISSPDPRLNVSQIIFIISPLCPLLTNHVVLLHSVNAGMFT